MFKNEILVRGKMQEIKKYIKGKKIKSLNYFYALLFHILFSHN